MPAASIWASTPTASWNAVKPSSSAELEYCDEFQHPVGLQCGVQEHVWGRPVAVVDDAQLRRTRAGRIGGLLRAPLGAVEGVEALDGQLEVDPRLGGAGLDQLGELGDLLQLGGVEDRLETILEAGLGQQRPGSLDVLGALLDGALVEERHERREDVVVGDHRPTLEQRRDHLLPIEREGQGLAHGLVDELAGVAPHPDLAVRRGLHLEDREVRAVEQVVATEHGELHEGVDGTALHRRHHRADVVEELHLLAVERGLTAPPVRIALERRAGGRVVAGQLPRPRSVGCAVQSCARLVADRRDQRLGVEHRDQVREVAVGALEVEDGDIGIGGVDGALGDDPGEAGVGGHDQAVHRRRDVGRREVAAVLPLDALAQGERPDRAVLVGLPRLGEARRQFAVLTERDEELEALGRQPVGAEVLHGDRVERGGWRLVGDPDDAAGLPGAGRPRRTRSCPVRRPCRPSRNRRCRHRRRHRPHRPR